MSSEEYPNIVTDYDIDEERLLQLLVNYVRIGMDDGRIVLTGNFDNLDLKQKAAVLLLAQRAKSMLGQDTSSSLRPKTLSQIAEINIGRIYPAVRELEKEGLVENTDGKYIAKPEKFDEIKNLIATSS